MALFITPAQAFTSAQVIDGFNKTVFGAEYSGFPITSSYVRKFTGLVRFHVVSNVGNSPRARVERFILSLNPLIKGLRVQLVRDPAQANFIVYVVRRSQYAETVRNNVFKRANAPVRGRCMVRSSFSRSGIVRSDAVIVADEGESLFSRCMTEEILQGLGPLNDDRSLRDSMFNDTSQFTSFRRFDRLILNMLYDPAIKVGASPDDVKPLLPAVLNRALNSVSQGN